MNRSTSLLAIVCLVAFSCQSPNEQQAEKQAFKAIIIDGSNNHYVWPKTTQIIKDYLEKTALFEVEIERMDTVWLGMKYNPNRPEAYENFIETYPAGNAPQVRTKDPLVTINFQMDFTAYDLVVLNIGELTPQWPASTKTNFENYMKNGGGLIVLHAANNAWGDWKAYNEMIGLGAWGDRDSTSGPYAFYNDAEALQLDSAAGACGSHGPETEFVLTTRAPEHPIMRGLPTEWLHTADELYARMRGPFQNATILATSYSDVIAETAPWDASIVGSGKHEPLLMAIEYGKGRVFHSALGHFDYSMECVGFMTTLQRGAEWTVTGQVTQPIPADFPTAKNASARSWSME
ncbi:MAG: hypothetical protein ACJAZM_003350 [Cyclobacteriaceae bacterium]|jgi:hypothetical protein